MMGMTLGYVVNSSCSRTIVEPQRRSFLVGPPVAGALDDRFGFRGPFIFGVIITAVEFIGRLLIIERKEAIAWDASLTGLVQDNKRSRDRAYGATAATDVEKHEEPPADTTARPTGEESTAAPTPALEPSANEAHQHQQLSIVRLLLTLLKSPRAMAPVFLTFIYGFVIPRQQVLAQTHKANTQCHPLQSRTRAPSLPANHLRPRRLQGRTGVPRRSHPVLLL